MFSYEIRIEYGWFLAWFATRNKRTRHKSIKRRHALQSDAPKCQTIQNTHEMNCEQKTSERASEQGREIEKEIESEAKDIEKTQRAKRSGIKR